MASESTAAAAHDEHGEHPEFLAHHFDTPAQQYDAASIGMWVFLAQEILFFSGLFVAYFIYRSWYPAAFSVGSHMLSMPMGAANTVVLLFSSFTAAQAVSYSQRGDRAMVSRMILITIGCAFIFLVVKYFEYQHKFHLHTLPARLFDQTWGGMPLDPHVIAERAAEIARASEISHAGKIAQLGAFEPYHLRSFFGIYFIMTGVHGLHVIIGIGVYFWIFLRNQRGEFSAKYFTPVHMVGLYWHLVDLIWIFLFPLLYLID